MSPESPDDLQPTPVPLQESSRAGTRPWSPAAPQGRSTQRTDTQLQLRGPPGRGPGAFERGTQASWETGSSMLGSPRLSISATTLPVEWGLGGSGALCPWGTHLVIPCGSPVPVVQSILLKCCSSTLRCHLCEVQDQAKLMAAVRSQDCSPLMGSGPQPPSGGLSREVGHTLPLHLGAGCCENTFHELCSHDSSTFLHTFILP